jgi:hypothetical protein
MTRRKLITTGEMPPAPKQLTKPCGDCPWRVDALPGWLGPTSPEQWAACVHADGKIVCHVHPNVQCAGAAIHRANVVKSPRDPDVLRLPADRENVFALTQHFVAYHRSANASQSWDDVNDDE